MPSLNAVFKLNDGYSRVIQNINRNTLLAEKNIGGASRTVDRLNQSLSGTDRASNIASSGVKKLASAMGSLLALKQGIAMTDEFINTSTRLNQVNDGLQTSKELHDQIYRAAQRSRGAYDSMAASVAKLGMMAGDAFGSTQEIVDFTELVQKSFRVGGASKGEQDAGMYQLAQAMASGRLQGDEFRSISENAPMITKALSQSLGVGIGQLRDMSSEGLLTADVVKKAMFDMADEINSKFTEMPLTFSDVGTQIKNHALYSFQGVMESANNILNSDNVSNFVNFFKGGIDLIAWSVQALLVGVNWLLTTITNGWSVIEPILIAAAMIYLPYLISQLWLMIQPIIAAAGAWLMMNMPILIIIGLISLFIFSLQQAGVTTGEIVGGIAGTFWALGAIIYNVFAMVSNVIGSFVNFLGNVFISPIAAIKKLFYEMALYLNQIFLGIAKQIENLLNAIPGIEVNITGGLKNSVAYLEGQIAKIDKENGLKDFIPKWELKDVEKSFNKGFNWGNSAVGSLASGGITPPGGIGLGSVGTPSLGDYMVGGALPVTNGGAGGSGGSLNVSIDKEDIQYLKDIADRDYVNKYTSATLAPNVSIQFGDVHETADASKIGGILEKILREEISVVQEG